MAWRRPLAILTACYVAARVLLAGSVPVNDLHPDTASYHIAPSFTGAASRPWVVPLLYSIVDGRAATIVQAVIGGLAFVVLAVAIASTLRDWRVRTGLMAIVLLLGLAPRTTVWDAALLTESLGISLTVLLIAVFVWLDRLPAWVPIVVFTLWVFTRDPHLYLGVLVLVGVSVWGWRRRRWAVPLGFGLVLVWGAVAAQNDDTVEAYNVTTNVAYYAGSDVEMFRWFIDHGMPNSPAFQVIDFPLRNDALQADPNFQWWARTHGSTTYARYLLTHPRFTFGAFDAIFVDQGFDGEALVDHTGWELTDIPWGPWWVWPREASLYTLALVATAALAVLWSRRVVVLPALLALSTLPHALIAVHATPFELARHGAELALVLVVACWWTIAAAVDQAVAPSREGLPTATEDSGEGGGRRLLRKTPALVDRAVERLSA